MDHLLATIMLFVSGYQIGQLIFHNKLKRIMSFFFSFLSNNPLIFHNWGSLTSLAIMRTMFFRVNVNTILKSCAKSLFQMRLLVKNPITEDYLSYRTFRVDDTIAEMKHFTHLQIKMNIFADIFLFMELKCGVWRACVIAWLLPNIVNLFILKYCVRLMMH